MYLYVGYDSFCVLIAGDFAMRLPYRSASLFSRYVGMGFAVHTPKGMLISY